MKRNEKETIGSCRVICSAHFGSVNWSTSPANCCSVELSALPGFITRAARQEEPPPFRSVSNVGASNPKGFSFSFSFFFFHWPAAGTVEIISPFFHCFFNLINEPVKLTSLSRLDAYSSSSSFSFVTFEI